MDPQVYQVHLQDEQEVRRLRFVQALPLQYVVDYFNVLPDFSSLLEY